MSTNDFEIRGTTIVRYHGSDKRVVILEGVTSIAEYAFVDSNLEGIEFPESLTSIGRCAFRRCTALKRVEAKSTLRVGAAAFNGTPWYHDQHGLITIGKCVLGHEEDVIDKLEIPEGVLDIADCAFHGFPEIRRLYIPDTVKRIGVHAFSEQSQLETVQIGDGLAEIAAAAFAYCGNLRVEIGSDLVAIHQTAFWGTHVELVGVEASKSYTVYKKGDR